MITGLHIKKDCLIFFWNKNDVLINFEAFQSNKKKYYKAIGVYYKIDNLMSALQNSILFDVVRIMIIKSNEIPSWKKIYNFIFFEVQMRLKLHLMIQRLVVLVSELIKERTGSEAL